MSSLKNKSSYRHGYALLFFAVIMIYNIIITGQCRAWSIGGSTYAYHLVDFSMGFCSKLLPGAIYNFLFDKTDRETVALFETVLFTVVVFIVSLLLEKLVISTEHKNRPVLLFVLTFFIVGSSTFSMYIYRLGMLDSYWLYFSILSLLCLSTKWLYIFIIPLSLFSVMTNYAALMSFVPYMVILMIYKTTVIKNKTEKAYLWLVLVVTALSSIGMTFYFIAFEFENLTMSLEEFTNVLQSRGFIGSSSYYETSLYLEDQYDLYDVDITTANLSPVMNFLYTLYYRTLVNFEIIPFEKGVSIALLDLPVVALFLAYLKKKIKENKENKVKVFSFFCMIAMFFATIIISLFLSCDIVRFIGHAYTLLFVCILYVIYKEKDDALPFFKEHISKVPEALILLYSICFAFMVFDPYC